MPDIAVGVMDTGESPLPLGDLLLWPSQVAWLKQAQNIFYAFHWYGPPINDPKQAIKNVQQVMERWNVAALMTEMEDCSVKVPAVAAGIGWSFWEYSGFCDRPVHAGEKPKVCPSGGCTFGACITGTNGNSWKNLTCA